MRWIVSGKTVLNNKGKPVKQYEPYFSVKASCCAEGDVHEEVGVTPLMYYDAVGRLVRTEMPDGTFSRVEFSPWHVKSFDQNDTVLESQWYQDRGAPQVADAEPSDPDRRAAWLSVRHADTPVLAILDSLGRDVVSIAHNRVDDGAGGLGDEKYLTFTKLDAEGKPLWIRDARENLVMQYITPVKPTRAAPGAARSGACVGKTSMMVPSTSSTPSGSHTSASPKPKPARLRSLSSGNWQRGWNSIVNAWAIRSRVRCSRQ